jgi:hypothetical protein
MKQAKIRLKMKIALALLKNNTLFNIYIFKFSISTFNTHTASHILISANFKVNKLNTAGKCPQACRCFNLELSI